MNNGFYGRFGINILVPLQKKIVANEQLVVTGDPWMTHQSSKF